MLSGTISFDPFIGNFALTFLEQQALMGTEVWLDPTAEEARAAMGTLVLSCMPALETVNSVWQTGSMSCSDALAVSYTSTLTSKTGIEICFSVHNRLSNSLQRYSCSDRSGAIGACSVEWLRYF